MSEIKQDDLGFRGTLSQFKRKGLNTEFLISNENLLCNGPVANALGGQYKELILAFLFETLNNIQPFHKYRYKIGIENYINTILKQNANIILSMSVELSHDKEFMFQVAKHQARLYELRDRTLKKGFPQFGSEIWRKGQLILVLDLFFTNCEVALYEEQILEFFSRNNVLMSDNMFRARIVYVFPQLGRYLLKHNKEYKTHLIQIKQQILRAPCLIEFLRNNPNERLFYFEVCYNQPYRYGFYALPRFSCSIPGEFLYRTAPDEIDACFDFALMTSDEAREYLRKNKLSQEEKRTWKLMAMLNERIRLSNAHVRNDKELLRKALSHDPTLLLSSKELQNDKELILLAVSKKGILIRHFPNKFKYDKDVVLAAVTQDMKSLSFASNELINDSEFMKTLIDVTGGEVFQYASNKLKKDYYSVLTAIKDYPPALSWASQNLQEDRYLQLTAVSQGGTLPPVHSAGLEACIRYMKSKYLVQFSTFLSTLLFATSSVYPQDKLPLCSMNCLKTLGKYGLRRTNTLIAKYAGVQFGEEKWKMISTIILPVRNPSLHELLVNLGWSW